MLALIAIIYKWYLKLVKKKLLILNQGGPTSSLLQATFQNSSSLGALAG